MFNFCTCCEISSKIRRIIVFILTIILSTLVTSLLIFIITKTSFGLNSFLISPIIITSLLVIILNLSFISGIVGIFIKSKVISVGYLIITVILSLVSLSFCVLFLLNISKDKLNSNYGCKSSSSSLILYYNDIDLYLTQVNKILCSSNCECTYYNANDISNYKENNSTYITEVISFSSCSKEIKDIVYKEYIEKSSIKSNDIYLLSEWYGLLENSFNCSGICNESIDKYLFSDVNKGKPKKRPCLKVILDWMSDQIKVVSILSIIIFIFSIIISACNGCLIFGKSDDD